MPYKTNEFGFFVADPNKTLQENEADFKAWQEDRKTGTEPKRGPTFKRSTPLPPPPPSAPIGPVPGIVPDVPVVQPPVRDLISKAVKNNVLPPPLPAPPAPIPAQVVPPPPQIPILPAPQPRPGFALDNANLAALAQQTLQAPQAPQAPDISRLAQLGQAMLPSPNPSFVPATPRPVEMPGRASVQLGGDTDKILAMILARSQDQAVPGLSGLLRNLR